MSMATRKGDHIINEDYGIIFPLMLLGGIEGDKSMGIIIIIH